MTPDPLTKPRRLSTTCHRHPSKPVTGFCALCLHERLAVLDSSATSASTSGVGGGGAKGTSGRIRAGEAELRRCQSYSASKRGGSYGVSEPRRKSCDVGGRNTLWLLFNLDDEENGVKRVESKNLGFSGVAGCSAFESEEVQNGDEIRVSEDALEQNVNGSEQRVEEEVEEEELKTMKEHIELEWKSRKQTGRDLKNIAGSFLVAASIFSQKLRKWRLKQRPNNRRGGRGDGGGGNLSPAAKLNGRKLRETQSEVGDYGFGRRSCDTDPRFSVDACRISLDDPRFSFDEPRASWDGYMIARTIPRLAPMLSAIDNVMIPPIMNKSEFGISVEDQMTSIIEDEMTSGGSAHTRDYCSDSSSSHRQNSFDCSSSSRSSNKKTVVVEVDEMKSIPNSHVSPSTIDVFHRMKFVVTDRDTGNSNFNSIRFDHLETLESASKDASSVAGGGYLNRFKKFGRWRKGWNILGSKHRLSDTRNGEADGNLNCHPLRDCEAKQGEEANGSSLARSGSCVSARSSDKKMGLYHRSLSVAEARGYAKKGREESVLERNRSARYSPSNLDNGLLRFHLTPLWSYRRKSGRNRLKNSQSIARSVLRLN